MPLSQFSLKLQSPSEPQTLAQAKSVKHPTHFSPILHSLSVSQVSEQKLCSLSSEYTQASQESGQEAPVSYVMWSATVFSEAESSQDKVSPWAASTASFVSFSSSVSLLFSDTPQPTMMSNRHKLSKVAEMKRNVIFMFSFLSA